MGGNLTRRQLVEGAVALALGTGIPMRRSLADAAPASFEAALSAARGQKVYFNAWGGDTRINDFIGWVGQEVGSRTLGQHGTGTLPARALRRGRAVRR